MDLSSFIILFVVICIIVVVFSYIFRALQILFFIAVLIGVVYAVYRIFREPLMRFMKNEQHHKETIIKPPETQPEISHKIPEKIEKPEQKILSAEEKAVEKAVFLSDQLFQKTVCHARDEKIIYELESLRLKAEERIRKAELGEINYLINKYNETIKIIDGSNHLTSEQRVSIYRETLSFF